MLKHVQHDEPRDGNGLRSNCRTPSASLQTLRPLREPFYRHSREGRNPSPKQSDLSTGFSFPQCQVMDSRLRGNDAVCVGKGNE
jgi:hypothetical protein